MASDPVATAPRRIRRSASGYLPAMMLWIGELLGSPGSAPSSAMIGSSVSPKAGERLRRLPDVEDVDVALVQHRAVVEAALRRAGAGGVELPQRLVIDGRRERAWGEVQADGHDVLRFVVTLRPGSAPGGPAERTERRSAAAGPMAVPRRSPGVAPGQGSGRSPARGPQTPQGIRRGSVSGTRKLDTVHIKFVHWLPTTQAGPAGLPGGACGRPTNRSGAFRWQRQ